LAQGTEWSSFTEKLSDILDLIGSKLSQFRAWPRRTLSEAAACHISTQSSNARLRYWRVNQL